jgi:hypothetical protein
VVQWSGCNFITTNTSLRLSENFDLAPINIGVVSIGLDGLVQSVGILPNERSQLDIALFGIRNPIKITTQQSLLVLRGLSILARFIIYVFYDTIN